MVWFIVIGVAAAWGVLSVACLLFGWLLPKDRRGLVLYFCREETCAESVIFEYRWLRDLGFLAGPLLLVDSTVTPKEREILERKYPEIVFCSLAELPGRLELERNRIGTRDGNPPGRDQRCGVSEL